MHECMIDLNLNVLFREILIRQVGIIWHLSMKSASHKNLSFLTMVYYYVFFSFFTSDYVTFHLQSVLVCYIL